MQVLRSLLHMPDCRLTAVLCLALIVQSPDTRAGVVVGGTRFILPEGVKGVTVQVRNTAARKYLVGTTVRADREGAGGRGGQEENVPFIVTPPLFALGAGREGVIRILPANNRLPRDRESLFWLEVSAIPSGRSDGNTLQVAVRSRFKLLWRPEGLAGSAGRAYQALKWTRTPSGGLMVNNPTPYVVTVYGLAVNGAAREADVVMPYAEQAAGRCPEECRVEWQSLDDYGRVMPRLSWRSGQKNHY